MPGIDGEDQSGVKYSPFLYVLSIGGNPSTDGDYHFVGQTQASLEMDVDPDFFPEHGDSGCPNELAIGETAAQYRLGVTVLGELVADLGVYDRSADYVHCLKGIPLELVPREARVNYLAEAICRMGEQTTNPMLAACGVEIPRDLVPITFEDYMDGLPDLKEKEVAWAAARIEIMEKYFPGWQAHWEFIHKKLEELGI